ncbi:MAG: hypothetical protein JWO36_2923 [Myxococcales bacterium]|nr:hypothetical protein [Myxococcales bacterium]
MSFKDSEIHAVSIVGTLVLTATLFGPAVLLGGGGGDNTGIKLDQMESIEASIAYRKTPQKQPQKKVKEPDPVEKPEGINHDEKKVVEKKPEDKKPAKPDDPKDPFAKYKHASDDDTQTGKPTTAPGDFNGNEKGYAEDTKGDPYWGRLRGDMQYAPPEISKGDSAPVGCIHLTPEGKIVDTKWEHDSGDDLQTAAEAAIKQLVKARNEHPEAVPTHLLSATTKWLCFKFTVKAP